MRIFFAGLESTPEVYDMIDNALFSYYYLKDEKTKSGSIVDKIKMVNPKVKLFIDSGAHSFFSAATEGVFAVTSAHRQAAKDDPPDIYMEKYIKWVQDYWNLIDWYVELDIGELVGQTTVDRWYEDIKKAGIASKCIRVFHPRVQTIDEWKAMLDIESKYVALEGVRPGGLKILPYNKLVRMAYEKNCKVHGFAMTKVAYMSEVPFYSVDSTSWQAGFRYGLGMVFDEKLTTLKTVNINHKQEYYDRFQLLNPKKFLSKSIQATKKNVEIGKVSIQGYKDYEKYLNEMWKKRGIEWKD